jgi:hypothetical protein
VKDGGQNPGRAGEELQPGTWGAREFIEQVTLEWGLQFNSSSQFPSATHTKCDCVKPLSASCRERIEIIIDWKFSLEYYPDNFCNELALLQKSIWQKKCLPDRGRLVG